MIMGEAYETISGKKRKSTEGTSQSDITSETHSDSEVTEIKRVPSAEQDMSSASRFQILSFNSIKSLINRKRKWWYTDFGKHHNQHPIHGLEFTLMSYNVLSQTLLENHPYLYRDCKPEYLTWDYRCQNLLREITEHNADIMCLQEVEENHYKEAFFPHLYKKGYLGLYKKKTGNACDGCAIFFKRHLFMLEAISEVEYKKPGITVLDRNNIGLVIVLKPKSSTFRHLKLVCATTHLLFNSRRGDVKLAQLRTLLATVEEMARKNNAHNTTQEYHPIILCGDMNSLPFHPLYDFIVRGCIKYLGLYSGNVSGQREGYNKGTIMMEDALTLAALGINHNTCYEPLTINDKTEQCSSTTEHLDLLNSSTHIASANNEQTQSHSFFHPLTFGTTYKYFNEYEDREVTTRHSRDMSTVDYIFYTVDREGLAWRENYKEKDGELKHIGCYGLLHEHDLRNVLELPNAYLSSDHFSLLSKFLITTN